MAHGLSRLPNHLDLDHRVRAADLLGAEPHLVAGLDLFSIAGSLTWNTIVIAGMSRFGIAVLDA